MRLAYLSSSVLPSPYANSVHVMKMASALARNGHAVRLFARSASVRPTEVFDHYGIEPRFELVLIPPTSGRLDLLRYPLAVRRALQAKDVDLLYGRDPYSLLACSNLGAPLVYEMHALAPGPDLRRGRNLTLGLVERLLLRRRALRRVVLISRGLEEDRFGSKPTGRARHWDTIVAPDGADEVDPTLLLRSGGGATPVVGYVGSLYPGRGIETILDLARRMTDLTFRIVGGGPDEAEPLTRKSGQIPNLEVTGRVAPREVPNVIAGFDIALAPYQETVTIMGSGDTSRWMSPMKIFEYMACGRAIVCSDLPVLREVLRHEENALLVPPADAQGWATAIRRILSEPGLAQQLGDQARSDLAENFTWSARAERVLRGLP